MACWVLPNKTLNSRTRQTTIKIGRFSRSTLQILWWMKQGRASNRQRHMIYSVHAITRKSLGDMTRKLSVTESHMSAQFRGTFSRKNPSVASANWAHVA